MTRNPKFHPQNEHQNEHVFQVISMICKNSILLNIRINENKVVVQKTNLENV